MESKWSAAALARLHAISMVMMACVAVGTYVILITPRAAPHGISSTPPAYAFRSAVISTVSPIAPARAYPFNAVQMRSAESSNFSVATGRATVFWVGPKKVADVQGIQLSDFSCKPDLHATVASDGHFQLPTPDDVDNCVVLDESGYAVVVASEVSKPASPIHLQAWGRIEESYKPPNRSFLDLPIAACPPALPETPEKRDPIQFDLQTTTGAKGNFSIDHVPSMAMRGVANATFGPAGSAMVMPEPGQTVHVSLGEDGVSVSGKIDLSGVTAANPPLAGQPFDTSTSWIRAFQIDPPPPTPSGGPWDGNSPILSSYGVASLSSLWLIDSDR